MRYLLLVLLLLVAPSAWAEDCTSKISFDWTIVTQDTAGAEWDGLHPYG